MQRRIADLSAILALAAALPAASLDVAGLGLHGFADARAGVRTQSDSHERDLSLGEFRLQLFTEHTGDAATVTARSDFLYDGVLESSDIDLEQGLGWIDLRELNVRVSPFDSVDVKAGRQILTWGVGDLLFINDLFPKDWNAFFSGRDTDYLKAPSDAVMLSWFPGFADFDVVYTPAFDSDRFISGDRISYWNPMLGRRAGRDAVAAPEERVSWFEDDEVAARARRMVGGYEVAAYGYTGYWKSPEGFDMASARPRYPSLSTYGASARGGFADGVLSLECGYYDSREDRSGRDPMTPNSQQRYLVGYDRELIRDLQGGVQYYVEATEDYDAYRAMLPDGMRPRDEFRHVLTFRVTKFAMSQNLMLSCFLFWSPSDRDAYLRPYVEYKASDDWRVSAGANVFVGEDDASFFGQFEKNNNVYAAVRRSF
jgi:hypothetical protein